MTYLNDFKLDPQKEQHEDENKTRRKNNDQFPLFPRILRKKSNMKMKLLILCK